MPLNKCTFCGRCPLRPIILFLQRPSLRAKALRSRTLGYRLAVSFQGHHPPQTDITSTSSRGDMSRRFLGQPPFHSPLPHCGVRALSPVGETRYHPHNTLYFHVSVSEWPVAFLRLFISSAPMELFRDVLLSIQVPLSIPSRAVQSSGISGVDYLPLYSLVLAIHRYLVPLLGKPLLLRGAASLSVRKRMLRRTKKVSNSVCLPVRRRR
jgi:hypothetical protein